MAGVWTCSRTASLSQPSSKPAWLQVMLKDTCQWSYRSVVCSSSKCRRRAALHSHEPAEGALPELLRVWVTRSKPLRRFNQTSSHLVSSCDLAFSCLRRSANIKPWNGISRNLGLSFFRRLGHSVRLAQRLYVRSSLPPKPLAGAKRTQFLQHTVPEDCIKT